jgi:hemerythrin-like domain-containing protein
VLSFFRVFVTNETLEIRPREEINMQTNRREFVTALLTAGLAPGSLRAAPHRSGPSWDPDQGVTAPEDLMKEHGVLNRCLLIYEEGIRRLRAHQEVGPDVFQHTAALVRRFVEQYHEKNEENHIFPQFKRAGKLTDLVDTLLRQHKAGRVVTANILRLSAPTAFRDSQNQEQLIAAVESFIRMYRPHEAREDTVLFPALRTILPPRQVAALGDRMEEAEHKVLGDEGFERSVDQVAAIEKQLGIYDLHQFTPPAA